MSTNATSMTDTNDMSGTVARTVGTAASGAHRAVDAASEAARPAVDHLAAGMHHTVDRVAGTATHAAETLEVKARQLRDAQLRFAGRCEAQVREKPVTALGIAAGAGLVLGWWLTRR